jgi:organic radical activating enzyme
MPRRPGENHRDYRKRVIDPISDSFCGAKWYNATIWLGHGGTASCHHPPAHNIDVEEIKDNPSAIHNTKHKKKMRELMLKGERPNECEYCWKIEDMGRDSDGEQPVSDRTFKTVIYKDEDIDRIATADPYDDVNLKTLEIAFDRTCNFACSYCNPAFSTTWVKDIRKHGGYRNIQSDARGHFIDDAPYADPFERKEINPFVDAFWRWWPELSTELEEIRVTGGEPMMAPSVWKLFDWFDETDEPNSKNMRFAINSNLGCKDSLMDKLVERSQAVNKFQIYTSCEAFGAQAEYIRDGLEWEVYEKNFRRACSEVNTESVIMMMTINALCLDSITEFLDWCLEMKKQYGAHKPGLSVNILRFPSFQSALTLPDRLRTKYHNQLVDWLTKARHLKDLDPNGQPLIMEHEIVQITRLIEYLDVVKTPHRNTAERSKLLNDFKAFYRQYDERRGKNFSETFPGDMAAFYESIQESEADPNEEVQPPATMSTRPGVYVKREVTEDGEVRVVERQMKSRQTGESDDTYVNDEEDSKPGSSIGWNTDTDGLGA